MEDFLGPLKDCHRFIKGFGGKNNTNVKIGKIKWSWLDNKGYVHGFRIPNSYLIPSGGVRLLSPQHCYRMQVGKNYNTIGVGEETTFDKVVIFWNRRKLQLIIPLEKEINIAAFYSELGYTKFHALCAESGVSIEEYAPIISLRAKINDNKVKK